MVDRNQRLEPQGPRRVDLPTLLDPDAGLIRTVGSIGPRAGNVFVVVAEFLHQEWLLTHLTW